MAAVEPVPPAVLAQLVELPVDARSRRSATQLVGEYEREGRGFTLGTGRRRLPLPDPPRRVPVRRAVRARRPDRAAVGPGARDARDRRLQAADRARAALRDPRRERRRDAEDARRARLRRGDRPRTRRPATRPVRHDATVPRTARPRLARPAAGARRLRARRVGRRGARARAAPARRTDAPPTIRRAGDDVAAELPVGPRRRPDRERAPRRAASVCRRCSRAPGSDRGARASS